MFLGYILEANIYELVYIICLAISYKYFHYQDDVKIYLHT